MKPGKILLISIIFILAFCFQAAGIDGGVSIDNETELSGSSELEFSQADKVSLWFRTDLGSNLKFTVQGSYTYTLTEPYFFNLDLLTIKGEFPPRPGERLLFTFTLGRFLINDFTENLLFNSVDGFRIGFHLPWLNLSAALGYTGFHFKTDSTILLSKADYNDFGNTETVLASPRLVGAVNANLADLIPGQNIDLSFLFQLDMRPLLELNLAEEERSLLDEGEIAYSSTQGGLVNTQYIGIGFSGTIVSALYYDLFGYLGLGSTLSYKADETSDTGFSYQSADILSYMTGVGFRFYIKQALHSIIGTKVVFSSGDEDYSSFTEGNTEGKSGMFNPISRKETSLVFSPILTNVIIPEIGYSIIPFENFQVSLKGLSFFRPTLGPISADSGEPGSSGNYLGTEMDVILKYRPFSDLGVGISYGMFFPKEELIEYSGKFELSLSF